jgi:hypothetical protein
MSTFGISRRSYVPVAWEHPFMNAIRLVIEQYQRKSQSTSGIVIIVHQHCYRKQGLDIYSLPPEFRIEVSFKSTNAGHHKSFRTTCRAEFTAGLPTGDIQAKKARHYISLYKYLEETFPVDDEDDTPTDFETLWDWSVEESESFNWAGLPVELKEHVLQFCLHQPLEQDRYGKALGQYRARPGSNKELGPYEVTEQLGDWYALLEVSKQIRAITIRLCLKGSSSLTLNNGLCINILSYSSLEECIVRLGKYYQMIEDHSVPVDEKTHALARCYSQFPKVYHRLARYATMRHGIQKICLKMDFASYMNFFKVTIGGFERYQNFDLPTYEVFEQLPYLNEIVIRLPLQPRRGWRNDPHQGGPQLFDFESPCPRKLHRVIFERAAEVLAQYKTVTIRNFIDKGEEKRFLDCREESIKSLKSTDSELQELYADEEGGIELERWFEQDIPTSADEEEDISEYGHHDDDFFPPKCQCLAECIYEPVFMRRY